MIVVSPRPPDRPEVGWFIPLFPSSRSLNFYHWQTPLRCCLRRVSSPITPQPTNPLPISHSRLASPPLPFPPHLTPRVTSLRLGDAPDSADHQESTTSTSPDGSYTSPPTLPHNKSKEYSPLARIRDTPNSPIVGMRITRLGRWSL